MEEDMKGSNPDVGDVIAIKEETSYKVRSRKISEKKDSFTTCVQKKSSIKNQHIKI